MAENTLQPVYPLWARKLAGYSSLIVPVGMVSLVAVMLVPLPPALLDLLITANLALSAVVLLTTVYVRSPLDFSVFPSLLLATTLLRIVLNVASTRLILTADAASPAGASAVAGRVIEAFGSFVAGGSVIVGSVIFLILIVVQFVVITKGATRISEVAARFTLDGMPGKQMAIDADLNGGLIDEPEARRRRSDVSREADFYGAMDGASKFIRGDAIATLLITVINICGGLAVGLFVKGWGLGETASVFTRLTIGDGLVAQVPAFIIAIAAGLIVTRSGSRTDLGREFTGQLGGQPLALAIAGAFIFLLAFTGLPAAPMLAVGGLLGGTAYLIHRHNSARVAVESAPQAKPQTPSVEKLIPVDAMELEVGYGLVKLVGEERGGGLLERIGAVRQNMALELGLVVPPVRVHDNVLLPPHDYRIKVRGSVVSQGIVHPGRRLAVDMGNVQPGVTLPGEPTRDPAMGLPAYWIDGETAARAEMLGYTVIEPSAVLVAHLAETVKCHAAELLTREETNRLIAQLRASAPKLVEEVIGSQLKPGELQKVLQNLLRERVPIRDLEVIVETLGDFSHRTRDTDTLTDYARHALRRAICSQYAQPEAGPGGGRLYCVTLDPAVEDVVNSHIERSAAGTTVTVPPTTADRITSSVMTELRKLLAAGYHPLVLASPQVRAAVRGLLEPHLPNVAVMGFNELVRGFEVESLGVARIESTGGGVDESPTRLQGVLD